MNIDTDKMFPQIMERLREPSTWAGLSAPILTVSIATDETTSVFTAILGMLCAGMAICMSETVRVHIRRDKAVEEVKEEYSELALKKMEKEDGS